MVRRLILLVAFTVCTLPSAIAQPEREPDLGGADPADVASIDAIMTAVYDVISGPAGPRDWDRFRTLFAPGARLVPVLEPPNGTAMLRMMSPDDYVTYATRAFSEQGFYETEIYRKVDQYGRIAQVFSTYASFRSLEDEAPFMRGINSFQLMWDNNRWWVVSIFWNHERPERPIPSMYLPTDQG